MVLAHELAHQPVAEIVEVVQPLADIGIGDAQHAGAVVGLHALDAGLGGQAGADGFAQPVQPALVVREAAVGVEHFAMLAAVGDVAALQHEIEIGAQRGDRIVEALEFLLHVVGDDVLHRDARLVQHDVAERDAFGQRLAGQMQPRLDRGLGAGLGERQKLARGDHLRQHHGGGLQRLLFLLGIGPAGPVLHHQHAERVAGAEHRHAEERMVDLFAGFRPEREGRVGLRLGQVDRIGFARHQADQAFVLPQHGLVDRLALEAFGGVQLERAVDPQHVDGADLRHHVGGNQHDDLVEAFLRADRFRHHLAEPAQQHARTAERARHGNFLRAALIQGL